MLIQKWIEEAKRVPATPRLTRSLTTASFAEADMARNDRHSYQTINSKNSKIYLLTFPVCTNELIDLLRVIRKGHTVKNVVDDAIDQCAEVYNLRDSIEDSRIRAEQATDDRAKKQFAQRGNSLAPA